MLREGILTSEAVAALNWPEEVFYRRLMSVVDDFGRYFGSPKLLRAACYPLQIDKVSDSDIGKWLSACETAGLVRVYPAKDGKRYLELLNFRQQVRAKASKYPACDEQTPSARVASATQPHGNQPAHAHLDVDEGGVVVGGVDEGDSVPTGTGADSAKPKAKVTDPNEIIFGYGVPMLTSAGTAEKQARSFLGGLRKHHGDAALIDKLRECIREKPLQPLEWLAKALPPPGVDAPKPEFASTRAAREGADILTGGRHRGAAPAPSTESIEENGHDAPLLAQ